MCARFFHIRRGKIKDDFLRWEDELRMYDGCFQSFSSFFNGFVAKPTMETEGGPDRTSVSTSTTCPSIPDKVKLRTVDATIALPRFLLGG